MIFRPSPATALITGAVALFLTSCRKPEVRVYLAPRDATPAPHGAPGHVHSPNEPEERPSEPAPQPQPERARPRVTYTLPEGWKEAPPGQVSLVAFAITKDGASANANVTPLPDLRGREALVVNMYRQQTGQPPIEQADLGKVLEKAEALGVDAQLLDVLGSNNGKPTRLITIIAHRDGRSWFFRISGDDALVSAQKPTFLEFVKSVKVVEDPAPASAAAAPAEKPAAPAPAEKPVTPAAPAPPTSEAPAAAPAPAPATPASDATPKPQP